MTMVGRPFAETFDFARPIAAPVTNAAGAVVMAAIDAPRFDHDVQGARIGMLIERGPYLGAADRLAVERNDDWHAHETMTVLHALTVAGTIERRAYYSRSALSTVDGCLLGAGHHIVIGAFPGFLPNRGGFVLYGNEKWKLMTLISAGGRAALSDAHNRPLLGG